MQKFLLASMATVAAVTATPAFAADAFSSFDGTQGAGGFTYGYTDGTTLNLFNATSPCVFGASSICLTRNPDIDNDQVPVVSKGGSYPTVATPTDALVLHPGNSGAESVYAAYTVGALGNYSYDVDLRSVGTDTTNGVGYTFFTTSALGVVTLGPRQVLPTYTSTGALTGTQLFAAGESFGVIIDYNGFYGGDSTALNFTTSAVPEPATWAMMFLGLGMIGYGLRRRQSKVTTRVAFA